MPDVHRDCDYPDTPTVAEAEGMAWWNAMTPPERRAALDAAQRAFDRPVSIAAWSLYTARN